MSNFNIIMYHQIIKSKDKSIGLKGLPYKDFLRQIKFIKKKFNILNPSKFYEKIERKNIKNNDCILTFDDGYKTNITNVFPVLKKFNIKAFFFPIVDSSLKKKIITVNKIQLILSHYKNKKKLFNIIKKLIKKYDKKTYNNLEKIILKINTNNVYDNYMTIIIKRLLQRCLKKELRNKIISILFKFYSKEKYSNLAKKLYMNKKDLIILKKNNHEIGMHSNCHPWLEDLNYQEQLKEIKKNFRIFKKNKFISNKWSFCYPYGSYNKNTLKILKEMKCSLAFTVNNKPNNIKKFNRLELSREDCNNYLG
jgi:peptidoglycan/xylan/chitin deacetylase (PgdA/CDA1 family)